MSFVETTVWTCDYCEKQVTVSGSSCKTPEDWVKNDLTWNEHYKMRVIFCKECFSHLFPNSSGKHTPPKDEFKKPFWKRFWSTND